MNGVDSYSVFTLYSPYRLVIDFKPLATASSATPASTAEASSARARVRTESWPTPAAPQEASERMTLKWGERIDSR